MLNTIGQHLYNVIVEKVNDEYEVKAEIFTLNGFEKQFKKIKLASYKNHKEALIRKAKYLKEFNLPI